MNPYEQYQNVLNTPLTSGSTGPMTIVTPKLAYKALNQVRQGMRAVNQAMDLHRANLGQQKQIDQQNQVVQRQEEEQRFQRMQQSNTNRQLDEILSNLK